MRNVFLILLIMVLVVSCGGPEPRKPVKVTSASFYKKSAERSRLLLEREEKLIQEIIANDTANTYQISSSGSWFTYIKKNEQDINTAQTNDLVTMTYNLISFDNDTIYSMQDIGIITYKVDKQELFQGLRDAVKLLKENETATFLFPSSFAYGYPGDHEKIGANVPLKSTLAVIKIEKPQDSIR
ncbi:gliding motility-associated peptidyl-prolyl isomerase GldI [Aurantibacter crassamenti]|uniref:gliding motility-associated peptidyl-prolyl isomerase GldI n=1 Tax=Aurantibacter crassamenti TaxID=1837375 RepID=UPI00193AC604|nr:gliding motility-associated peptidyl-prolyl isomerase GldI [Aurantibacter crassamenti]MBM1106687.1 gliding motility-associated peptidyl-prolyl isomerase GldI [Aurantibacter crassamenti]